MNLISCRQENTEIFSMRKGSVLLFLVAIVSILAFLGIFFSQNTSDSRFIIKRQTASNNLRSFARTVSHFVVQKLQQEVCQNKNYWLRKEFLSRNLDELKTSNEEVIDIDEFSPVVQDLKQVMSKTGKFSYSVKISSQPSYFSPTEVTSMFFPAEKKGFVKIEVFTNFNGSSEVFKFMAPVKVTSTALPGLSKFSLFLLEAAQNSDLSSSVRFNVIESDSSGQVIGNALPLVLNNGHQLEPQNIAWENFFKYPVGLIYLGGGETRINLSAAVGPHNTDLSEAFHFYMNSKTPPGGPSPFYMWKEHEFSDPRAGYTQFLRYDSGISSTFNINPLRKTIYEQLSHQTNPRQYLRSSALRLFGSDLRKSPTLVFGEVYRGLISFSMARTNPFSPYSPRNEIFSFPQNIDEFEKMRSIYGSGQVLRLLFSQEGSAENDIEQFRENYATDVSYTPYNLSLAYYATNNVIAGPVDHLYQDKLVKLISPDSKGNVNQSFACEIPKELSIDQCINFPDLIKVFQSPLITSSSRFAWVIDMSEENCNNLDTALQNKGLLNKQGELSANGWVRVVNCPKTLVIKEKLKIKSNSAIVFDSATNLHINQIIEASKEDDSRWILQLIVLDGDIVLNADQIDASLAAPKGVIEFKKNLAVNGAMLMKDIRIDEKFPGGKLNYNPSLAQSKILGMGNAEDPTLSFCFQPIPFFVE